MSYIYIYIYVFLFCIWGHLAVTSDIACCNFEISMQSNTDTLYDTLCFDTLCFDTYHRHSLR